MLVFILRLKETERFFGKLGSFFGFLIGTIAIYFIFNWIVAGDIWPNTFYAKQAEYADLRNTGYLFRYMGLFAQFVTGAGILLIPGMIVETIEAIKKRNWTLIAGLIWILGFIGLYAWRLPVAYQHGRYIIPVMPLGFLVGITGMIRWIDMKSLLKWKRVISITWFGSVIVVTIAFLILGARAYAYDVAVIESEMVKTAKWIDKHTERDAVVAAHDIGALGYFTERKILDLAGLITPDVIPFIRDEMEIRVYLDQNDTDYLMTFPDWYPKLVDGLEIAYRSNGSYAPDYDQENMTLFFWK
jgi:hypothetical protein